MSKNKLLLENFTDYCRSHQEQRFWQALSNWSGWMIIAAQPPVHEGHDTFYWEETKKE